ncbi:hypothetical protein ACFS2C_02200 [Prauserella oleivorans]|uniref:Uncharacterized protein n=1 Tax=Prauserella oleivorans TaxID=1478153 RepID=A0ABW5W5L5_9PSEU
MDVPGTPDEDNNPTVLAARAEEAARLLYEQTSVGAEQDGADGHPAIHEVLGSLKLLAENLARYLPELSTWLEHQLWAGQLGDDEDMSYDELTKSTFEVAAALARAHRMSAQLGRELQAAQTASRDLIKQ